MAKQVGQLQDLLDESRFTLVITGAGISVASGIPDMGHLNLLNTLQFASNRALKAAPEHYYRVAEHFS